MKRNNWNFLVYVHGVLLLWVVLFVISSFIPDGGKTARVLAVGNVLFLFANIPLGVFCLIVKARDHLSKNYEGPAVVLSIVNIIVGVVAWLFAVMFIQSP